MTSDLVPEQVITFGNEFSVFCGLSGMKGLRACTLSLCAFCLLVYIHSQQMAYYWSFLYDPSSFILVAIAMYALLAHFLTRTRTLTHAHA